MEGQWPLAMRGSIVCQILHHRGPLLHAPMALNKIFLIRFYTALMRGLGILNDERSRGIPSSAVLG